MKLIKGIVICLLFLPVFLAGSECRDEMFDRANNLIAEHKSTVNTRLAKEKILSSLRSRDTGSFWDVAARNSREKLLLRRNRLNMEITSLQSKENGLSQLIAGISRPFNDKILGCAYDPEFGRLYTEIMSISAASMLSGGFLSPEEAERAIATPEGREFLTYRAELQEQKQSEVSAAIEGLKASKKAFMDADRAVPAAAIESLIGELTVYLRKLTESTKKIKELSKRK